MNEADCVVWHVAQSSPGGFASRLVLFGAGLCIEWHVRQVTVAELGWARLENESCVPRAKESVPPVAKAAWPAESSWQERQSCAPTAPLGVRIRLLSPPASMCFVPSPWHVEQ